MAKKGGERGGSFAARSAAAKKGWETRRRGGAKAKPAATKRTVASKAKGTAAERKARNEYGSGVVAARKKAIQQRVVGGKGTAQQRTFIAAQNLGIIAGRVSTYGKGNKAARRAAAIATKPKATKAAPKRRGMPKTTSARGRALTNQRRAADLVRASRGGKGPSAKAVRSVLTAQRARAFYAATGGGKKRSAVKAKSAVKIGKQIRAEGRAKATAARAKVAGRPRNRVVAKPPAQRQAAAKSVRLPRNSGRLRNRTGSSKRLTRYNSTQSGSGRRPLDVMGWERDAAKARLATKTDRSRSRTKERRAKQAVTDRRASRATANQARVTAALKKADGSGFRRGTRKERRSIFTAQAALSFYRSNAAVDTQRVDVRRPGFRLPRSKR